MARWIEETFHPHWRVRLEASKVLHEVKTAHHHLVIFENETWGTVLMLDGVCQLTTSDEFVYHEMMAHVPLMALIASARVLVIGGGDGGVLREVLKHPSVAKATLCEIDRTVVDLSLKHYPQIADGCFDDPRADVVIADGLAYVADTGERFDAIIVDSSEPIGPSAVLHTREFFHRLQARAEERRHPGDAERFAVPVSRAPAGDDGDLRLAVQGDLALHVHATLLLRRAVRAECGERRRGPAGSRRSDARAAHDEARHHRALLHTRGASCCVRLAGICCRCCRRSDGWD
jgi:hypothetical protein